MWEKREENFDSLIFIDVIHSFLVTLLLLKKQCSKLNSFYVSKTSKYDDFCYLWPPFIHAFNAPRVKYCSRAKQRYHLRIVRMWFCFLSYLESFVVYRILRICSAYNLGDMCLRVCLSATLNSEAKSVPVIDIIYHKWKNLLWTLKKDKNLRLFCAKNRCLHSFLHWFRGKKRSLVLGL